MQRRPTSTLNTGPAAYRLDSVTPQPESSIDNWHTIGQTSNQLILYHPPSHALVVQPHTYPSSSLPGPSTPPRRLSSISRPPLLLPPVPTASRCPYCSQLLPETGPQTSPPDPFIASNTTDNPSGRTPYFRILEQAHEGSRPPSPRLKATSPSPSPSPSPYNREEGDHANSGKGNDDLPGRGYYGRFFREEGRLGMGAEGSVFLATHVIGDNVLGSYAVKKIAVGESKEYLVKILREVRLLETLRHPNIIPYHHAWIEPTRFSSFGPPINALHVLMAYATAGNLDSYLLTRSYGEQPARCDRSAGVIADQDSLGHLPKAERIKAFKRRRASGVSGQRRQQENRGIMFLGWEEVASLFGDVVEGLAFLHSNSILHLDLKCSNVLLHWVDGALIPRAMISDFGTSEEMLKGKRERSGHTGTMEYMAPETIVVDERGEWRPSDSHADMWSLGMILFKMLFLHMPYTTIDDFDALQADILRYPGFIPTPELIDSCERRHIPRDMLLLLSKLVHVDPESRPSAEKVRMGLRGLRKTFNNRCQTERGKGSGMVARFTRQISGLRNMVLPVDVNAGLDENRIEDVSENPEIISSVSPGRMHLALPSPDGVAPSSRNLAPPWPSADTSSAERSRAFADLPLHPEAHIIDPLAEHLRTVDLDHTAPPYGAWMLPIGKYRVRLRVPSRLHRASILAGLRITMFILKIISLQPGVLFETRYMPPLAITVGLTLLAVAIMRSRKGTGYIEGMGLIVHVAVCGYLMAMISTRVPPGPRGQVMTAAPIITEGSDAIDDGWYSGHSDRMTEL